MDGLWCRVGCKAFDDVTSSVDEEFCEVPLDGLRAEYPRCGLGQVLVQRIGRCTVDINLRKYREGDLVIRLAELLNFLVGARLLTGKLIAGEPEYAKSLVVKLLIQLL